jgi:hypothetical protein
LPEFENVRATAEAIGLITCIKTGEEIGLLYRWDNGETQAAMYKDGLAVSPTFQDQATRPDLSAKRS